METGITVRTVRTEEDAMLRECAMMGAIRRKEEENRLLRVENARYKARIDREMALKFERYAREIAAEKKANKAYAERMTFLKHGLAMMGAAVCVMVLAVMFAFMCVGG
jgi:regulator of replication initiation timing